MGEKMNEDNSYIKLSRKILRWEWYLDPLTTKLFIHLLLIANIEDRRTLGYLVKRGQVMTTYSRLAEGSGLSLSVVQRCLKKLTETGEIKVNTDHHHSIVTIVNYDRYQGLPRPEPPPKKEKPKAEEKDPEFERWANQ